MFHENCAVDTSDVLLSFLHEVYPLSFAAAAAEREISDKGCAIC